MNFTAVKFLRHNGWRMSYVLKRSTCEGPCPPPKPSETRQGPPSPLDCCPNPPPCPPKPSCPPALCPPNPDPNNPCNYCPPPCVDPDNPDLSRIKKLQCIFQEDDGLPVYLKLKRDVILYHTTLILTIGGTLYAFYGMFELMKK